jgi:uncharacterized membrane protein
MLRAGAVRDSGPGERGSLSVLIIGYTALAAVVIVLGIDVSKVFLARRALASAADAAALAGAQAADTSAVYDGRALGCGRSLPLDPAQAADLAAQSVAGSTADLHKVFRAVDSPRAVVDGTTVTVTVRGELSVPLGRVWSWLNPADAGGVVRLSATSHARSPLTGPSC